MRETPPPGHVSATWPLGAQMLPSSLPRKATVTAGQWPSRCARPRPGRPGSRSRSAAAGRSCWFGQPCPPRPPCGHRALSDSSRSPGHSGRASPAAPCLRVYLGLFGASPRGIRGRWAPREDRARIRSCVRCQERCRGCSLIWSGNFFPWRRSRGSVQASRQGECIFNYAKTGRPVRE